jgi:hypothetical protein
MVETLNLPQNNFRFFSVMRQGQKANNSKKANGKTGERDKNGECSGYAKGGGGIRSGSGFGVWSWVWVQEKFGRNFTGASVKPVFVEEMGAR